MGEGAGIEAGACGVTVEFARIRRYNQRFMQFIRSLTVVICLAVCSELGAFQSPVRMVRSLSGTSGRVEGAKFVFERTSNKFSYPQEKTLIVYFEFQGTPGVHQLTAIWKHPDGSVNSISEDVKLETKSQEFASYWEFAVRPDMPSGFWEVQVRVDGQPAGSHTFELVVPKTAAPEPIRVPAPAPQQPTMEDLFALRRSLVWVHRLDAQGRRLDTGTGFVFGQDQVATAFQVIDGSANVQVEFADGKVATPTEIWGINRLQDWVLLKVPTGQIEQLKRSESPKINIGDRILIFNVEANLTRVIGGVDIVGRNQVAGFGERLILNPAPSLEAAGGPILDLNGNVVALFGGSLLSGARVPQRALSLSPLLFSKMSVNNAAIPISFVQPGQVQQWTALQSQNVFSVPLGSLQSFLYGGLTTKLPKSASGHSPDMSEFSRNEASISVYTFWQRKEKAERQGMVSARIFDPANRQVGTLPPSKLKIPEEAPIRHAFAFTPTTLPKGFYRIDISWNDTVVWRTFFSILD